jgi:hypothetical protein
MFRTYLRKIFLSKVHVERVSWIGNTNLFYYSYLQMMNKSSGQHVDAFSKAFN